MIPRSPMLATRWAKLNGAPPSTRPEGSRSQSISPNATMVNAMLPCSPGRVAGQGVVAPALPGARPAGVGWAPMKYSAAVVVACLSLLALASCASGSRDPYTGAEPAVRDLGQFEAELRAAVAGAAGVTLSETGPVSWEGFSSPIWMVHVERPGSHEARARVRGHPRQRAPAPRGRSSWCAGSRPMRRCTPTFPSTSCRCSTPGAGAATSGTTGTAGTSTGTSRRSRRRRRGCSATSSRDGATISPSITTRIPRRRDSTCTSTPTATPGRPAR